MYENNQMVSIIMDCVYIAGSTILMFVPLSNKRIRERWAKAIFFVVGLIGVICYSVNFILNMRWVVISSHNSYEFYRWFNFVNGLLLGWLTALFFSGQAFGKKLPKKV